MEVLEKSNCCLIRVRHVIIKFMILNQIISVLSVLCINFWFWIEMIVLNRNKKLFLPCCCWLWYSKSTKQCEWWSMNMSDETNTCSYFAVTNAVRLNWQKNQCDWWSMNLSASKIWKESNLTKIYQVKTNKCTYIYACI